MEDFRNIGEIISFYRKRAGITQKDLAKKVGISPSYMSMVEKGRGPSDKITEKLTKAIGIKVEKFYIVQEVSRKGK
jgi:transcriptional regulator with XRE-family HTH domain